MKRSDRVPKARRNQLMIKELANETLVYDESNHQAPLSQSNGRVCLEALRWPQESAGLGAVARERNQCVSTRAHGPARD
jgi:hypothetical protein